MGTAILWLTVVTAVLAGVIGGVFFAFSSFVMPALSRLVPAQGIAAMQSVNVAAVSPAFMTMLFVPALSSLSLLVVVAVRRGEGLPAAWLVGGSVLYLAGIVLTAVFHVPRNDALAVLDPEASASVAVWTDYVSAWTAGNHVRMLTSVGAAACLTWAAHGG